MDYLLPAAEYKMIIAAAKSEAEAILRQAEADAAAIRLEARKAAELISGDYEVEAIAGVRSDDNGRKEYLIVWSNYPGEDCWVPKYDIADDCKTLIDDYEKSA